MSELEARSFIGDGIKLWRIVREAQLFKVDERDSFDVSKGARSKEITDRTLSEHKNLSRPPRYPEQRVDSEQQDDLRQQYAACSC